MFVYELIPYKLEDVSGMAVFLKSYPRSPFIKTMPPRIHISHFKVTFAIENVLIKYG